MCPAFISLFRLSCRKFSFYIPKITCYLINRSLLSTFHSLVSAGTESLSGEKKKKRRFKTTLESALSFWAIREWQGITVMARLLLCYISRAAKFLLLLPSVELSSEGGTDPSRGPGASPSQPRDPRNQPHCQLLKYQWGNKGRKTEDF